MPHDQHALRIAKWLEDVRDAAAFILQTCQPLDAESFVSNRLVRQAVERNFQIIDEALRRLDRHAPDIACRIEALPRIISFRNIIVHAYDGIDADVMWQIVQHDTVQLLQAVEQLLRELNC